jgi:predicted secreted Zn-dependent protease
MIKQTILTLFIIAVSHPVLAEQDTVKLASLEKGVHVKPKGGDLPPLVSETYEYYEIQGNTARELHVQMSENGSLWKDGRKYASVTSWQFAWNYDHVRTEQHCSADAFTTAVAITFRFPRWQRPSDAPPALVDTWESYVQNLERHETGHRDMAVEAAADLNQAVANLPPAATCVELDRQIKTLCSARIRKLNHDEKAYDVTTDHGMKQGALFP